MVRLADAGPRRVKELVAIPAVPASAAAPAPEPALPPMRWAHASVDELVQAVHDHRHQAGAARGSLRTQTQVPSAGARVLLERLAALPEDTWQDRWSLVDAATSGLGKRDSLLDWREHLVPGGDAQARKQLTWGLGVLLVLDVFRPSYPWQQGRQLNVFTIVSQSRDPESWRVLDARIDGFGQPAIGKHLRQCLGKLQLHTGKSVRQLTAQDLLNLDATLATLTVHTSQRRAVEHVWRLLTDLGWICHESVAWPLQRVRQPQLEPHELVDLYQITGPQREVFVEYLKQRRATLDYVTYRNVAQTLLGNFWADVASRHPGLPDFRLTREIAEEWKRGLQVKPDGQDRLSTIHVLLTVRSFYLDMSQWALEDSYWAPWVAPSPVFSSEVGGYAKLRRRQVARIQQRTRQLAPLLPRLVAQAMTERQTSEQLLAAATAADPSGEVEVDGQRWAVRRLRLQAPVWIDRDGKSRNLTLEEDLAFWTWAVVETLRLTGIRSEELHELTHLSMVPYRLPSTGRRSRCCTSPRARPTRSASWSPGPSWFTSWPPSSTGSAAGGRRSR